MSEADFTLNVEKCEFNMFKLVCLGHILSEKGIGPADVKVKAEVEAREHESASEILSFMGLVNYSARFIPDLATVAEPLCRLTKKDVKFIWGREQQTSFDELKNR